MVIAELPLWLVHSDNIAGTTILASDHARSAKNGSSSCNAPISAAAEALHTLNPLQAASNTRHKKKCAIYSIDVIPSGRIFATAGGDGKVRLWNARALFASSTASDTATKGAHFDAKSGAYVSSESSASESDEESKNGVSHHTLTDGSNGKEAVEIPTAPPTPSRSVQVHDLNAVVRRKKDGSHVPSKIVAAAPSASSAVDDIPLSPTENEPTLPPTASACGAMPFHPSQHRLLCTLSAHTGSSVLAVRFSTSGEYLASAGDDACVCIYAPSAATHVAGNLQGNEATLEHWARIKLCRGHGLDVVDLAWAPDDSHLVSCSLDSATPIIVWKLSNLGSSIGGTKSSSMICAPFKVLGQSVHTSTVKGVTFDPAGSYLASSGDDPAVCIWRAHDDWGLEKRIDSDSGVFRHWVGKDDDIQGLSTQSMFRRLSWSTDGAFVCSTNSIVKNKHVASAISRDGWSVSGSSGGQSSSAANLVGHKQPVIASRHSTQLLNTRQRKKVKGDGNSSSEEDSTHKMDVENDEPEYATLLALGDRQGFITVWGTHQSRPLFKLQCSESRCPVTDLAWGSLANGDLMLLVSLLDGQVVTLRFSVPGELGALLTKKEKARVFQLRYGIDLDGADDVLNPFQRRLFVGGHARPKLIENPLQMALEEGDGLDDADDANVDNDIDESLASKDRQQQESRSPGGKKRIRPIPMESSGPEKNSRRSKSGEDRSKQKQRSLSLDPLQTTMEAADRAVAAAETVNAARKTGQRSEADKPSGDSEQIRSPRARDRQSIFTNIHNIAAIPHSTDRVHTVDLPNLTTASLTAIHNDNDKSVLVAECVNSNKVPLGSKGSAIPCVDVSLTRNGQANWRDQIPGTSCSAIAASRSFLAVGTTDGSIQLFGTSPTVGWSSGSSFRSHPPLIIGQPIVSLQLKDKDVPNDSMETVLSMVVVSSDGSFGVWRILPELCLEYKGTLLPAFLHMSLSLLPNEDSRVPKLARVQVTESDRLVLLLSFEAISSTRQPVTMERTSTSSTDGPGGSLQGFVYDKRAELWLRMSDARFLLSDFYSALPTKATGMARGVLSQLDDAVRVGCLQSSLKDSQRGRLERHADEIYDQGEDESGNFLASRSHCEDRMACALALHSASEFKHWLGLYTKTLVMRGHSAHLRMLVDMILGQSSSQSASAVAHDECWWLSQATTILNEDRKAIIRSIVVPEMSKNRALQRITNEISLELDNM